LPKKQPEIIRVRIANWEKYHTDSKGKLFNTSQFFRLQRGFMLDPKIQQLNHTEFRVFLAILDLSRDGACVTLVATLRHIARIYHEATTRPVSKLLELGLILPLEEKERREERTISKKTKSQRSQKSTKSAPKIGPKNYPPEFLELWKNWPSDGDKGSKKLALKNIEKLSQLEPIENLYQYAWNYVRSFSENPGMKFPYRLSNFFGEKAYWESFKEEKPTREKVPEFIEQVAAEIAEREAREREEDKKRVF